MLPNYGEGKAHAFRRLEEEIHKLYKGRPLPSCTNRSNELTRTGVDFEQYAVRLNLASLPEAAKFVAREEELSKMHELLLGHGGRSAVVLRGLGGSERLN